MRLQNWVFGNSSKVLLCITNISVKHQSFVHTQLNDLQILGRFCLCLQSVYPLLEMASDIALIEYLICIAFLLSYTNLCINSLNMFIKDELKLEMMVAVCWNYRK